MKINCWRLHSYISVYNTIEKHFLLYSVMSKNINNKDASCWKWSNCMAMYCEMWIKYMYTPRNMSYWRKIMIRLEGNSGLLAGRGLMPLSGTRPLISPHFSTENLELSHSKYLITFKIMYILQMAHFNITLYDNIHANIKMWILPV